MPTKRSAIDALRKLEADRQALDERQRELEEKATLELGQLILGSGVEAFSRKGLRQASEMLGKLGEAEALRRLGQEGKSPLYAAIGGRLAAIIAVASTAGRGHEPPCGSESGFRPENLNCPGIGLRRPTRPPGGYSTPAPISAPRRSSRPGLARSELRRNRAGPRPRLRFRPTFRPSSKTVFLLHRPGEARRSAPPAPFRPLAVKSIPLTQIPSPSGLSRGPMAGSDMNPDGLYASLRDVSDPALRNDGSSGQARG